MSDFQPGDRVKYLHGTESGTVVAILSGGLVRVEVDGFDLEYAPKDLVYDGEKPQHQVAMSKPDSVASAPATIETPRAPGIWLACSGKTEAAELNVFLINNSADVLFLQLFVIDPKSGVQTIRHTAIRPGAHVYLMAFMPPVQGKGKEWHFQIVPLPEQGAAPGRIMEITYRAKPSDFKNIQHSEALSCFYSLTDAFETQSRQQEEAIALGANPITLFAPDRVDLHAEYIDSITEDMSPVEIFDCQFTYFVNCLDNAIAMGKKKITFIHGIGDGKLRDKIYKHIGNHVHVDYYSVAEQRKGGEGATEIVLKK
jgi:hypothetical protein